MLKQFSIILFLAFSNFAFGQISIKGADASIIGTLEKNYLLDSIHQVLYNYKGFIIFNKLSNNKNDIVLTLDIRKSKAIIFNKVETTASWVIKSNYIVWKKGKDNIDIIKIEKQNGFTSFYNENNDSLIGFVESENLTGLELSLAFFHLWNELNWEEKFDKQIKTFNKQTSNLEEGILGLMKPVFGDDMNVWLWDGKYLFHAYNNDQRYVWEFDGETLKPIWNSRIENEWSWDGDELKPFWGGHPRNNWRWDNDILRQVFENNYKNEYEIVDNIVRKRFGSFGEIEWQIEGEIPLPVLTLVILGIVYR